MSAEEQHLIEMEMDVYLQSMQIKEEEDIRMAKLSEELAKTLVHHKICHKDKKLSVSRVVRDHQHEVYLLEQPSMFCHYHKTYHSDCRWVLIVWTAQLPPRFYLSNYCNAENRLGRYAPHGTQTFELRVDDCKWLNDVFSGAFKPKLQPLVVEPFKPTLATKEVQSTESHKEVPSRKRQLDEKEKSNKKVCSGVMEKDLKMLVPLWSRDMDEYEGVSVRTDANTNGRRLIIIRTKPATKEYDSDSTVPEETHDK